MSRLIALEGKRGLERARLSLVAAQALVPLHTLALCPSQHQRSMSPAQNCFNSGPTRPRAKLSKAPIATGLVFDSWRSAQQHPAEEHSFSLDHCSAEAAVLNVQEIRDVPYRWEHLDVATLCTRTQLCPEMLLHPC